MANSVFKSGDVVPINLLPSSLQSKFKSGDTVPDYLLPTPLFTTPKPEPESQGILRSAADIPINIGKGAVGGVGLIADTLGADNEISKSIYGVESWLDSLLSAQAKNDQQEIARIMQDAQDKGAWEQVKAGLKALSVAPVDLVSNALGYAAPVAISALALPEAAVGTAAVGLGSAMGVGTVKNAIYNSVLEEAKKAGVPEDEAKKAADAAQSYTGDNLDLIMTGGFLGGLASATGLEKTLVSAIGRNVAKKVGKEVAEKTVEETAKGAPRRFVEGAFKEAAPEALQGAQEQYARNVAAQRAGYDVPTMRGVAGAGALEGLVGGVTGGGADVFLGKPTAAPEIGKGDLDTGIGDETIDETAEFENLKVDAESLGVPVTSEDNVETLADKIQAKKFENEVGKEVGKKVEEETGKETTVAPQLKKLRETAKANNIAVDEEDTEEDIVNKLIEKSNTVASTPASAPIEEAAAPTPTTPDYAPFDNLPGVTHLFKTARGSTYAQTETGQTVRNRSGEKHKDSTVGVQPASGKTIYLTESGVQTLGGVLQNVDIATQLVPAKVNGENVAQVVLTEDYGPKKKGDVLASAPYTVTPKEGLSPVEIWNSESPLGDDARGIHFGNKIIEVTPVKQPVKEAVTPAPTPVEQPVEQPVKEAVTPTPAPVEQPVEQPVKETVAPAPVEEPVIEYEDNTPKGKAWARRNRKTGVITINPKELEKRYNDKAWTKPKKEGVAPLPEDTFKTLQEWQNFVVAHEKAHAVILQNKGESLGDYENRINAAALDQIGKPAPVDLATVAPTPAPVKEAVTPTPALVEQPTSATPNPMAKILRYLQTPFTQESKKTTTQYTEEPTPSDTSYDVDQENLSPEDYESLIADLYPVESERAEDAEDAAELAEEEFELYGSTQDVEYEGPERKQRKIFKNAQERKRKIIDAVSNQYLTARLELENPKTEAARKKVLPALIRELEKKLADLSAPTAGKFLAQQPPERLEGEELDAKVMDLADGVTNTLDGRYTLAKLDFDTGETTNLTDVVRTHAAEEAKELLTTNNYIPGVTSDAVADRIYSRISNLANLFRYVAQSGNPKEAIEALSNKLLGDKIAKEKEVEIAKTIAENHPDIEILNAPKYVAPPLSDAGVVLVTNGDTGAVIDHIIKTTNDPIVRRVMSAIRGLGLKTRLVVQESTDPEFGGNYDSNADTITIDPTQINEPVLVHELIHAAISHVLSNTKLKFTQDLTKLFNLVKKKLGKRYGTRNIDEFASELISNKAFQEEVKALDRGNIFTRIVRAIAEFFNFSPRTSIFDEAVDTITDIISISNQVFKNGANRGQLNELAQGKKTKEQRKIEDVTAAADRVVRESGLLYTLTHTLSSKDSSELSGMFRTIMNKAQRLKFTQALTTRGLFDVAKKIGVAPLATVEDILLRKIPELRNKIRRIDDRLIDLTLKWGAKNPKNLVRLGEATNAARIYQIDPSKTDVVTAIENDETVQYYDARAKDPKYRNNKDYNLKRKKARIQQIEYAYKKYDSLGGEGRSIYKSLQEAYKKQLEEYEAAIRGVVAEITNTLGLSEATDLQEKLSPIFKALFSDVHKVGVYFPLGRHGDYWIRIGKGKNGETQFFDSEFARDRYRRQVERDTPADKLPPIEVGNNPDELKKTLFSEDNKLKTTQILQDVFAKIDGLSGQMNLDTKTGELSISQNALSGLKDEFLDMYLRALPGADLRKRYLRSTQKAGFSSDVLRTFIVSSYKHSNQLPRIKYGMALATQLDAAVDSAEGQPVDSVSAVKDLTQAIKERAQPELAPDSNETWLDAAAQFANQATFLYTMTSLKTALVAFTQLPTFGASVLTAKYGAMDTMAMMAKYTGLLLSTNALSVKNSYTNLKGEVTSEWVLPTIENSTYLKNNPRLAAAHEQGGLWGVFEQGFGSQFKQVAENPTYEQYTPAVRAKKTVYGFLTAAFSTAERVSREIMFMSAYELAYNKAKKEKVGGADANARALLEAEKDTAKSMFDYSRMNKQPMLYKNAGARVFFQFMTFPLNAAGFLIRNAATMLSGLQSKDPVAAKQAAIELFGTLGAIYMFAGVTGLPMFSLIMGLLEGLRDQLFDPTKYTDPEDPRSNVPLGLWFTRTYIPSIFGEGSGVVSGPISTMLDVDIGSSVGLNNLFFRDEVLADGAKDWVQQAIFSHLSPPALSVVGQIASGVELMNEGKFLRGAERIVPAFFRGTLVANRLATEGSVTPMGAELIQPEFFTAGKLIAQGVGFKTVTEKEIQNAIFEAKRFDEAKKIERNKLLNELNNAYMELEAAEKQGKSTDAAYAKMNTIIEKMITYSLANPYRPFETENINSSLRRKAEARAKATVSGGLTAESDEVLYYLMRMTKLGLNK